MKFFTLDWWRGFQTDDASNPSTDYGRHLDAICDRLPADLLALQESISLHDAQLRLLVMMPARALALSGPVFWPSLSPRGGTAERRDGNVSSRRDVAAMMNV